MSLVIFIIFQTLQCGFGDRFHFSPENPSKVALNGYKDLFNDYNLLSDSDLAEWNDNIIIDERSQLESRDREFLSEHSANSEGFQYISGGAGEGDQHLKPEGSLKNQQNVKSDDSLPFYCHPPNPCPSGYRSNDGCYEFIEDNAEEQKYWIEQMQLRGMCACDEEHMFNCPRNVVDSSSQAQKIIIDNKLNDAINNFLDVENKENPWVKGDKRRSLAAKKSPIVKRDVNYQAIDNELDRLHNKQLLQNPFMEGKQLPIYAKKMSLYDA